MSQRTVYPGLIGHLSRKQRRNLTLSGVSLILLAVFFYFLQNGFILDDYGVRVINLCFIYSLVGISLNLIQGYTGQFSLGSAGFMAIGAYVTTLCVLSPQEKEMLFLSGSYRALACRYPFAVFFIFNPWGDHYGSGGALNRNSLFQA